MHKITELEVRDIRFPTSLEGYGSDAMNPDPDYSAAYVVIKTDRPDGIEGHGLAATIGRGTEIVVAAVEALRPLVVGQPVAAFTGAPGAFWSRLTGDSQLRWIGPEKGAIHLATAAVVNALWDLRAKIERKPLWKLLSDLTPEQIVELVDWRYLTDALGPGEALSILGRLAPTRAAREAEVRACGYPAYTTSAGWLGYSDDMIRQRCREALAAGWTSFKVKVGADFEDDLRRCTLVRTEIGSDRALVIDASQSWDVHQAIDWVRGLAHLRPLWIEEPTSPDDVLGHATIAAALEPLAVGVATGGQCQNRVVFKQLLQTSALSFCQIDGCRLGGVNEAVAVLLLAAKFGVPACPHGGGVGLCEYALHQSVFDFICVSGSMGGRMIEHVGHLHEHLVDPCVARNGRYQLPTATGAGVTMRPDAIEAYAYPAGAVWKNLASAPPGRAP